MDNLIIPIPVRADLDKGIKKTYLDMVFATQNNEAHRADIQLVRGNVPVDLSGASVTAYFIRYSDNVTISLDGEVSGGTVSVKMKKACYNKPGQFALVINATADGVTNTVFYGEGSIFVSATDTILDEEHIIPSLDELLAQIDAMEAATANANTATDNANKAMENANTAAENAEAKADLANDGAWAAFSEAQKLRNLTVSAEMADEANAVVSDVNGAKHIAFSLPAGPTPNITFEVETGPAGTDAVLKQSGTAQNPVVHLTIPRGDTGAIDGLDYYEGTPEELGTASTGDANGVARGDHVHPMPTASDVGALAQDAQATDSAKLDGKTLAELMLTIYPVGSIYMSANSISPETLFGGTWEALKDRFLLGAGSTYTAGATGGAATVTLTTNQIPSHSHALTTASSENNSGVYNTSQLALGQDAGENGKEYSNTNAIASTGGGGAHNNMPPYLAVYMWKRVS